MHFLMLKATSEQSRCSAQPLQYKATPAYIHHNFNSVKTLNKLALLWAKSKTNQKWSGAKYELPFGLVVPPGKTHSALTTAGLDHAQKQQPMQ